MADPKEEMAFLESVTGTYITSKSPQDRLIKTLAMRTFAPYLGSGKSALEFGCLDGFMTGIISECVGSLTVVDGSKTFLDRAKKRVRGNVDFVHSLFEDFCPDRRFDRVFAAFVLEHVNDAVGFLKSAASLLAGEGLVFIVVPNARALSRQLARHMGLLGDLYALTPNDINHGHRRVYDRVLLNRDIQAAGLLQVGQGGLLLKPFADFQMDKLLESELLGPAQTDGLYEMGLEYPDLAAALFSICRAGKSDLP